MSKKYSSSHPSFATLVINYEEFLFWGLFFKCKIFPFFISGTDVTLELFT